VKQSLPLSARTSSRRIQTIPLPLSALSLTLFRFVSFTHSVKPRSFTASSQLSYLSTRFEAVLLRGNQSLLSPFREIVSFPSLLTPRCSLSSSQHKPNVMSQDGIDKGEHPMLVVEKTNRNREDLTAAISQRWSWQHLATIPSSTPQVPYLQEWIKQARNFTRYAFNKIGLASSQSSNQLLTYNEWEYIKGYFVGIKNACGVGKLYELPYELVRSFSPFFLPFFSRKFSYRSNLSE